MLNKDFELFLKDTLGINQEALKNAITSDTEVEVKHKSGVLLDDEALESLKNTVKSEGYNDGKTAGLEMAVKSSKEKYGLEFDGKSLDSFANALKTKTLSDAKINPDKKVKELSTSLENLQTQYSTDIASKDENISALMSKIGSYQINSDLVQHMPSNLKGISSKQFATLARAEYNFSYEDDSMVVKQNGKTLKDKMENPISPKEVLASFANNNGWSGVAGRGGGDTTGGSSEFKTMHDVFEHLKKNSIDPNSDTGQKIIDKFNSN